jgi:hypothetical protein
MALQTSSRTPTPPATIVPESRRTWLLTVTSLIFIVLQSACTAVVALSGVRVAIGLGALAVATFGVHAPRSRVSSGRNPNPHDDSRNPRLLG